MCFYILNYPLFVHFSYCDVHELRNDGINKLGGMSAEHETRIMSPARLASGLYCTQSTVYAECRCCQSQPRYPTRLTVLQYNRTTICVSSVLEPSFVSWISTAIVNYAVDCRNMQSRVWSSSTTNQHLHEPFEPDPIVVLYQCRKIRTVVSVRVLQIVLR